MTKLILQQIKTSVIVLCFFTILTGLAYPLIITLITQWMFPWQANGSLIEQHGKIIGSKLIGQSFTEPKYFWGRYSATILIPYNGASSAGSNFGPLNPKFLTEIKNRVTLLHNSNFENKHKIPVDLVTASASGLDPDISPQAAFYQVSRIAKIRGLDERKLFNLIHNHIQPRTFGILGEPRVNVLQLNIALDNLG